MTMQERASRTRRELIKSAAQSFDRHGYEKSRVAEISSDAGVSPGALHFHFPSKAALAAAVTQEAGTLMCGTVQRGLREGEALQTLVNVFHLVAELLRKDVVARAGYRLGYAEGQDPQGDLVVGWRRWVESQLLQSRVDGSLAPDVSVPAAANLIVSLAVGVASLGRRDPSWLTWRSVADILETILPRLADREVLRRLDPAAADLRGSSEPG